MTTAPSATPSSAPTRHALLRPIRTGKLAFGTPTHSNEPMCGTRTTILSTPRFSVPTLPAHHDIIYSANFSKDGKRIVTASEDGTARVWDVATGVNFSVLSGHTGHVFTAEFSRNDDHIVTASDDGTARVWKISPNPGPFAAACARIATIGVDLRRLLDDLATRYGLTGLKPICGVNAPEKIDFAHIQE